MNQTDEQNYLTTGLNKFFSRGNLSSAMMEDQASFDIQQISGSNLASGISKSADGKLTINWDKKEVIVNDGAHERVVMGNIIDDVYGIKIYDDTGTLVFDVTSGDASISSSIKIGNSSLLLDGTNRRIIVNDGEYDRVLIGYQENGF